MQPILDLTPFDEPQLDDPQPDRLPFDDALPGNSPLVPPLVPPIVEEYDDDYLYSPFAGIGAFLTGRVDVAAVRATFASSRASRAAMGGTESNGYHQLAELLDDTCLGRVA